MKLQELKQQVTKLWTLMYRRQPTTKILKIWLKGQGLENDMRLKRSWERIYNWLVDNQKILPLFTKNTEDIVRDLLTEFDNYAPLPIFRKRTSHLSFQAQTRELYRLEREGVIELSSLEETRFHLGELDRGILQTEGDSLSTYPGTLFYIIAA